MPKLFAFGRYVLFFWVGEDGEPVHVHISVKRPEKQSTKVWLTGNGGCLVASNASRIPERDLNDMLEFIALNHAWICERWSETFGELRFYC
ncbi:DUF4160 domain-containing protein [Eggerthellaceae bacterium zg-893]|nr:DUF4160 domain-containing protein [Eggerthellaceae bacterium zg-893]